MILPVTLFVIFAVMAIVSLVLIKTKKTDIFYAMPFFMNVAALFLLLFDNIIHAKNDFMYFVKGCNECAFFILPLIAFIYFIVYSITFKILRLKNIVKTEPKRIWKILGVIGFILSVIYLILLILAVIVLYYAVMAFFDRLGNFLRQFQ